MAATDAAVAEAAPKKASKLPLILGLVLMLALGGGGFYATYSGLVGGGTGDAHAPAQAADLPPIDDLAFVPLDPIVVLIGEGDTGRHLRFSAQLQVSRAHEAEVAAVRPRIADVLNTYLRAVELPDLSDRKALPRLRAQMLRRVQIVTGSDRVSDLLIIEFVLN